MMNRQDGMWLFVSWTTIAGLLTMYVPYGLYCGINMYAIGIWGCIISPGILIPG